MRPAPRLQGISPYAVPAPAVPVDLDLRGNEGARPDPALLRVLSEGAALLRRYPDARPLEARLAAHHHVAPTQVLVTAGADEALDRICRSLLGPDRDVVFPAPGFEMTSRYVALSEGRLLRVPWPDADFPLDAMTAALTDATALVVVTSPNNPTGAVASAAALRALQAAAPQAVLLVDLAYVEYADEDLTETALSLPNAVVVRTFSKARGLAGLRVGYAVGPAPLIRWMRAAGGPYPVSAPSLAVAQAALDLPVGAHVAQVRRERAQISGALRALGARVVPSQANFVFARVPDAHGFAAAVAHHGIGIRTFPDTPGLRDAIRIACPGDPAATTRLLAALSALPARGGDA